MMVVRMVMVMMMHGIIVWRWHARILVGIVHHGIASIVVTAHAFAAIHAVTPSISAVFF